MGILIFRVVGFIVGMHQTIWGRISTKKWREFSAFLKKSYFRIRIRHLIITKLKGKADILSLAFGNGSNACLVANLL